MRQLIAGNWKMHGRLADIAAYAATLRQAPSQVDLLVCPPFPCSTALPGRLMAAPSRSARRTATLRPRARIPAIFPPPC